MYTEKFKRIPTKDGIVEVINTSESYDEIVKEVYGEKKLKDNDKDNKTDVKQ